MRQWHPWVSVVLEVFLLVMAVTGLTSHVIGLAKGDAPLRCPAACASAVAAVANLAVGRSPPLGEFVKHLHSGEYFVPVGVAVGIASGLALLFFASSVLGMYGKMFCRCSSSKVF